MEEYGPDDDVRDALGILYIAGADTVCDSLQLGTHYLLLTQTAAALEAFLHCMWLFPDIARKVQAEIDSVTHGERMLSVSDRSKLVYTEAVWKESWRWRPFVPIGVPHVARQDEVVEGYLIPKGTLININNGCVFKCFKVGRD